MDLELAKTSGDLFIPNVIADVIGRSPRVPARVKAEDKFFIVQEQHTPAHRCTISTASDLPEGPFANEGSGDKVAVTLVKRRLTTPAAIEALKSLLGNRRHVRISYAGLKDRWAITAQRVVIEGIPFEEVVRCCMPDEQELYRSGIFIKDPQRTRKHLHKGALTGNNFDLRVIVPGLNAGEINDYLTKRLTHITADGAVPIPNFLGRQRLGVRQQLFGVGYDFIHSGPEVAIKRFLSEVSPSESEYAGVIRRRLLSEWEDAEKRARDTGSSVEKQVMHLQGMKQILDEGAPGRRAYEKLNMLIEYRIVCQLLQHLSFNEALKNLKDDFSLWVGAYQGFWFNQVLGRVLSGELKINHGRDGDTRIPLFMDEKRALNFYRRYCPEAIPTTMDPTVREMFLKPRTDRGGPRRPMTVPVLDLEFKCADEMANIKFTLRSGAYATTFLGVLFDIDGQSRDCLELSSSDPC